MQKKLLSLAIAGALAIPGAAMADVTSKSGANITVYGKIHASWDYVDNDGEGDDTDDNTAVFRNSRLGFKGSEDLGNGLKGIWQVETQIDTGMDADSTGDVRLRNTFVGLSSDKWGTIKMGRHDTPYKLATDKLDIFKDTIADYNNIIGSHMTQTWIDLDHEGDLDHNSTGEGYIVRMDFNERANQLLMYETPNFNGFSAAIARESFSVDEERMQENGNFAGWDLDGDRDEDFDDDDEWEALSIMLKYEQGPFFASLAMEEYSGASPYAIRPAVIVDPTTGQPTDTRPNSAPATNVNGSNHGAQSDEEIDAWKIGLGYTFGNSVINFVYEDIDSDEGSSVLSREAYWAGFAHKFGATELKLAVGFADDTDVSGDRDDDEASNWSIGVDHNFSKRTKVYAVYSHMDNDTDGHYGIYQGDNGARFADPVANAEEFYRGSDGVGNDLDAFSVGIVHSF